MRVIRDADRDPVAVIQAALAWDAEAVRVIVNYADIVPLLMSMAELSNHECGQDPNEVGRKLDRYMATVNEYVLSRELLERQQAANRAHIATTRGRR